MNRMTLNTVGLNTVMLPTLGLPTVGWPSARKGGGIPSAIRRAMVLWYDIERQGCTNENMAENPILKDLSGNGYDARCYNFGWEGMSGIGGYAYDFTSFSQNLLSNCTANKFDLTKPDTGYGGTYKQKEWFNQKFTLRITNFNSEVSLIIRYYYTDEDGINQMSGAIEEITSNGDYIIDGSLYPEATGIVIQFTGQGSCTIEQLPLYPNALVSDGVDDYCLAEGLPLLTREKGYTVVARRKWFTNEKATAFVAKNTNSNGNDGGFQFEYVNGYGNNFWTSSFASNTSILDLYTSEEAIVYQTSKNYNGQKNLIPKAVSDTGGMALFRFSVDGSDLFGQFALYSLLLFNRDLTEDEINWVKTNLIEKK